MRDLKKMLQDRYGLEPNDQAEYLNETITGLLSHRVCRAFEDRELDAELLNLLLACAQWRQRNPICNSIPSLW